MRRIRCVNLFLLAGLSLVLPIGCDVENFDGQSGYIGLGDVSTRKSWTIRATGGEFRNLPRAIDGNGQTFAISGRNYQNASLTVDLGRSCNFNCVSIYHNGDEYGYARKVTISTSLDGSRFIQRGWGPGNRKVTYLLLMTPVRARYIRLTAATQGSRPWSISEIQVQ